ncbi:hypothetical protein Tco_1011150 [Tanacetum coccineum]
MCFTHSANYALSQYVLYAFSYVPSQYVLYALSQHVLYTLSQHVLYALSQYVFYALSQHVLYALSHSVSVISISLIDLPFSVLCFAGLNDQLFLDSDGCAKNPVTDKDKQPTMAVIFVRIHALRKEVALVKVDDERIAKLERLVNQIIVNEGNGGSSKDPMSTCSRPDMDNVEVAGDGMPIGNADGNHDIRIGLHNAVNQGLGVVSDGMPISNADGNHDIDIVLHTAVNQGLGVSSNDPMLSSCPADIDNGEVVGDGIGIVNFDGKNDIPNDNPNSFNQVFGGLANDPMSTCSLTDMDNGEVACDGELITIQFLVNCQPSTELICLYQIPFAFGLANASLS